MTLHIVFVCSGNICRSPMAELVFRHHLEDAGLGDAVRVSSAGIGPWHAGEPADKRARATLKAHGYPTKHIASEVSADDLNAWIDIDWHSCSPLEKLLDPAEFQFLERRGMKPVQIRAFRAKRRSLFRMYMRRLTHDFNTAHSALKMVLVTSEIDRPDLVRELGRQRLRHLQQRWRHGDYH